LIGRFEIENRRRRGRRGFAKQLCFGSTHFLDAALAGQDLSEIVVNGTTVVDHENSEILFGHRAFHAAFK
jgi:hypothetical protein